MGTTDAVGQVVAGVGSPIVVDGWGRWPRGWPKTCSLAVIGEGTLVPHGLPGAVLQCHPTDG